MRLPLAAAYHQLGDRDRAGLECDAARRVFEALGAAPALARLDDLVRRQTGRARPAPVVGSATITDRERDVLRLVAGGSTNKAIAARLAISERTVERHLGNIFTRLDVSNRAEATAYALDHGLL